MPSKNHWKPTFSVGQRGAVREGTSGGCGPQGAVGKGRFQKEPRGVLASWEALVRATCEQCWGGVWKLEETGVQGQEGGPGSETEAERERSERWRERDSAHTLWC